MERSEEYDVDPVRSLGTAVEESPEFLDADSQEPAHVAEESVYTDDPVRVYLREMGSVRLLNRQGEVDLAVQMERGKRRMHKALSRSPLAWRSALVLSEDVRKSVVRLEDFVELGTPDDGARDCARIEVTARLARLSTLSQSLVDLNERIASTPSRCVNVRAKLIARMPRLHVQCSQEFRGIPFRAAQWTRFRVSLEHTVAEIDRLDPEVLNSRTDARRFGALSSELESMKLRPEPCSPRCGIGLKLHDKVKWKPDWPNPR